MGQKWKIGYYLLQINPSAFWGQTAAVFCPIGKHQHVKNVDKGQICSCFLEMDYELYEIVN